MSTQALFWVALPLTPIEIKRCLRKRLAHFVAVQWVPTTDMPSDGFTKPLSTEKHIHFVRQLGLVDISSRINSGYASEEDSIQAIQTSSETE